MQNSGKACEGTVLRIEKISPNDGQGLRTVVFLKGCPLRCRWCSTPESQSRRPELFYKAPKCTHCGRCLKACPQGALSVGEDRRTLVRDHEKCIRCGKCVEACYFGAQGFYGGTMTVDEVMYEIRRDSLFHFFSQGGVTISGGDVLLQADFAAEILRRSKEECLHTMAELDMFGDCENVRKIFPYLDGCFTDIKLMDPEEHRKWTGVSNETILRNISQASREFPDVPIHARVPLIPGVNDSPENLRATAEFCGTLPSLAELEFLPFHRLGSSAYEYLGRQYEFQNMEALAEEEAEKIIQVIDAEKYSFPIRVH